MKTWLLVFFGCLGGVAGVFLVIWLNVQVYQAFGDAASFVAVVITLSALVATLVTGLKKAFE